MVLEPLPVVIPLLTAAVLSAAGDRVPRRVSDVLSMAATAAALVISLLLMVRSAKAPLVYWFGGWTPAAGVSLGVSLLIDPLGAGMSALAALLCLAAFAFALSYFDSAHSLFHVLLLIFLGGLTGFALSGDLFNLFAFFELMGVSAFALCGYKSEEEKTLQGAINFAVTNTLAGLFILIGVGLLYGKTGALNMAQVGRTLQAAHDPVVLSAFAFITCGLFVKSAVVPLHFWLADAHAVAPSPVCVLFSGVMVEVGLLAFLRIDALVFEPSLFHGAWWLRHLLATAGIASACIGALLCFAQRHLKRMLAFSTISHAGLMLFGIALLSPEGQGGAAVYVVGHALVKGAMFLCAGIVLHRLRSVDEIVLMGRGRELVGTGVLMTLGALALAGAPLSGIFLGAAQIDAAAKLRGFELLALLGSAAEIVTGAALLRATARIFLGWGTREPDAPGGGDTHEEPETTGRGLARWTMLGPAALLLALGVAVTFLPGIRHHASRASALLLEPGVMAAKVLDGAAVTAPEVPPPEPVREGLLRATVQGLLAVALAAGCLFRKKLPEPARRPVRAAWVAAVGVLRAVHTGDVSDYAAWAVAGLALFGGLCAALFG